MYDVKNIFIEEIDTIDTITLKINYLFSMFNYINYKIVFSYSKSCRIFIFQILHKKHNESFFAISKQNNSRVKSQEIQFLFYGEVMSAFSIFYVLKQQ